MCFQLPTLNKGGTSFLILFYIFSIQIRDSIEDARKKAHNYFLDEHYLRRKFEQDKSWLKTRVKNPDGLWSECLVIPLPDGGGKCGVMLQERFETHTFDFQGQASEGRMMVKVQQKDELIDPFDFRYSKLFTALCVASIRIILTY
jgi:hypothetical protein